MAYIQLNNVTFTYPDAEKPAVKNLSLEIENGQFVVLFGSSGSGKSTLLRLLKKELHPYGKKSGDILINDVQIEKYDESIGKVGFVFQDPENQLVADQVLHELVFGLENYGVSKDEMRNRVAEMVTYFDIETLLHRKMHELSGGQKQKINLASVLLMQPNILLLDEPTAQLDPVSAREFLNMIISLNEEFGMTIIMAEHRLEEVFSVADQIVLMEDGEVLNKDEPSHVLKKMWSTKYKSYIPSIPSLYLHCTNSTDADQIPLTIKEGRNWLRTNNFQAIKQRQTNHQVKKDRMEKELLRVKDLFFQYDKESNYVITDLNLSIHEGDFYALCGANGSGKSTLMKLLCGVHKSQKGKIFVNDLPLQKWKRRDISSTIGYLPQNPKLFFLHDTIGKEITETISQWDSTSKAEAERIINALNISHLLKSHPLDVSGGELQKAALVCILLRKPKLLILDEPTKGLDPVSKQKLADILLTINEEGTTILMSTHDVEFASKYATKCGMMFQGKITSESKPYEFFQGNFFYTSMIQRLFRNWSIKNIVTLEEAVQLCKQHETPLS